MFDKILGKNEYEYLDICEKLMVIDLTIEIPKDLWMADCPITHYVHRMSGDNPEYVRLIERANLLTPQIEQKYDNTFTPMSPIRFHRDYVEMKQWIANARGRIHTKYSVKRLITKTIITGTAVIKDIWQKFSSNQTLMVLGISVVAMFIIFRCFPSFYTEMKPIIKDLIGLVKKD